MVEDNLESTLITASKVNQDNIFKVHQSKVLLEYYKEEIDNQIICYLQIRYRFKTNIQQYTLFQQVPRQSLILLCPKPDELDEESSTRRSSPNLHYVATKNQTRLNLELNPFPPVTESTQFINRIKN